MLQGAGANGVLGTHKLLKPKVQFLSLACEPNFRSPNPHDPSKENVIRYIIMIYILSIVKIMKLAAHWLHRYNTPVLQTRSFAICNFFYLYFVSTAN